MTVYNIICPQKTYRNDNKNSRLTRKVGGLDAHADNKTNKIIANVMFVLMLAPV